MKETIKDLEEKASNTVERTMGAVVTEIMVANAETKGFIKGMAVTLIVVVVGTLLGFIILPTIFSHFH